jgi:hypothetical protein
VTCLLELLVFVFSSSVSIYGYGTLVSHTVTKSLTTVIICSLCAVALIVLMRTCTYSRSFSFVRYSFVWQLLHDDVLELEEITGYGPTSCQVPKRQVPSAQVPKDFSPLQMPSCLVPSSQEPRCLSATMPKPSCQDPSAQGVGTIHPSDKICRLLSLFILQLNGLKSFTCSKVVLSGIALHKVVA